MSLPAHRCPSPHFDDFVNDSKIPFFYRAHLRLWGIAKIVDETFPDEWWLDCPLHQSDHCPWCGKPFPPSLETEYEAALAKLGLTPESEELPQAFRTDTWWRQAGLGTDTSD